MPIFSLHDAVALILSRNAPVLCIDTCCVLDILREPYRENHTGRSIQPADTLEIAVDSSRLTILAAHTITVELHRNTANVVDELNGELRDLDAQINRAASAAAACGVQLGPFASFEKCDLATPLKSRMNTFVSKFVHLEEDQACSSKAMDRAIRRIRPARKGNVLDAIIIEHYLEVGRRLVASGFARPVVFASSNTSDYCDGRTLHPDLDPDFVAATLQFVTDFRWAISALGI
jgi:hypothetical protein